MSDAAAVVNDQLLAGVRALPAISLTPVVMVAVYDVEAAKDELGLKVAILALVVINDTVPEIRVPALFFKVYVEVVTVELCTASLNVATIEERNCYTYGSATRISTYHCGWSRV